MFKIKWSKEDWDFINVTRFFPNSLHEEEEEEEEEEDVFFLPDEDTTFKEKVPTFINTFDESPLRTHRICRLYDNVHFDFLQCYPSFSVFFLQVFEALEIEERAFIYKALKYSRLPGNHMSDGYDTPFPFIHEEHMHHRSHADYYSCKYDSTLVLVNRSSLFDVLQKVIEKLCRGNRKHIENGWHKFKKVPVVNIMDIEEEEVVEEEVEEVEEELDEKHMVISTPATHLLFTDNLLRAIDDIDRNCGYLKSSIVIRLVSDLAVAFVYGYSNGVFIPPETMIDGDDIDISDDDIVFVRDNPIFRDKPTRYITSHSLQGKTIAVLQQQQQQHPFSDSHQVYTTMLMEEFKTICIYCRCVFGLMEDELPLPLITKHHLNYDYLTRDVNLCCGLYTEAYKSHTGNQLRTAVELVNRSSLITAERALHKSGSDYSKTKKCDGNIFDMFRRKESSSSSSSSRTYQLLNRLYTHLLHQLEFYKLKTFGESFHRSIITANVLISRCVSAMQKDVVELLSLLFGNQAVYDIVLGVNDLSKQLPIANTDDFDRIHCNMVKICESLIDYTNGDLKRKLVSFCELSLTKPISELVNIEYHRESERVKKYRNDFRGTILDIFLKLDIEMDKVELSFNSNNDLCFLCISRTFGDIIDEVLRWLERNSPEYLENSQVKAIETEMNLVALKLAKFMNNDVDRSSMKLALYNFQMVLCMVDTSVTKREITDRMNTDKSAENYELFIELSHVYAREYFEGS